MRHRTISEGPIPRAEGLEVAYAAGGDPKVVSELLVPVAGDGKIDGLGGEHGQRGSPIFPAQEAFSLDLRPGFVRLMVILSSYSATHGCVRGATLP